MIAEPGMLKLALLVARSGNDALHLELGIFVTPKSRSVLQRACPLR